MLTPDNLLHIHPKVYNLLPINQIILPRPLISLSLIPRNPSLNMPPDQSLPRRLKIHLHKPKLIHQPGGPIPRLLIQTQIIPLEENRSTRRRDEDVIFDGILDGMVETGRADIARVGGHPLAQPLDELEELLAVEGERGASAGGRVLGVGHLGELRAGEVVAIHWEGCGDERCRWVLCGVQLVDPLGYYARKSCLARAWDPADGDQEAGVGGPAAEFCWMVIVLALGSAGGLVDSC